LETLALDESPTTARTTAILATLATHMSDVRIVKHAHLAPVYLGWAIVMADDGDAINLARLLQVAGEHDVVGWIHAHLDGAPATVTHDLECTAYYGLLDAALSKFDHRSLADVHVRSIDCLID